MELHNPLLLENLKTKSPWIVLSLVAESEKQAAITPEGERLRKELEEAIQANGGEVLPLSLADRMKLERLWSLPYSGRFSDELKKEALSLHAGIITGNFPVQSPEKVQLLLLTSEEQKSLVFHEDLPQQQIKPEPNPIAQKIEPQGFKWVSLTDNLEPSRQSPEENQRRRSANPQALDRRKERLQEQLNKNIVLQRYKEELAGKSEDERSQLCGEFIQKANNSIMTSSKIEMLSRAYIINEGLKNPDAPIRSQLLEQLISHEDFYRDRRN